jgi:uncharacterized membrane protein YoaK (UPF0700 family)
MSFVLLSGTVTRLGEGLAERWAQREDPEVDILLYGGLLVAFVCGAIAASVAVGSDEFSTKNYYGFALMTEAVLLCLAVLMVLRILFSQFAFATIEFLILVVVKLLKN